jgi:hypothetical protein
LRSGDLSIVYRVFIGKKTEFAFYRRGAYHKPSFGQPCRERIPEAVEAII